MELPQSAERRNNLAKAVFTFLYPEMKPKGVKNTHSLGGQQRSQ